MRDKFADVVYKIGKEDKRICALVADISPAGSMLKFREKFPSRFINCGVAVDGSGNVYVSDWRNHRIQKFALGD